MINGVEDPIEIATYLADDFSEILGIDNFAEDVKQFGDARASGLEMRNIGDVAGIAGLFVGLIALIIQIRKGNTYQRASRDEIVTDLISKLGSQSDLSQKTREKLIVKLIDKIGLESCNHEVIDKGDYSGKMPDEKS